MTKKKGIRQMAKFFTLLIIIYPSMCFASDMGDLDVDVEIAATSLHEWMPSVTYNPVDNEFLVLWHSTGVREEGGEKMYSLHGQRISPDGQLLGETFSPVESFGPERRILPRAAHNPFTNQYMVSFAMGQKGTAWDPFIAIIASDGSIIYGPVPISEQPTKANHVNVVFNSIKRQYLVVYNDSRNGIATVFGVILNEDGTIAKEDFTIKTSENMSEGGFINAFACYNPQDDTYLVNWEDFRNVSDWMETGNIYGALLDGEGNIIVNDIPMVNDHGMSDEGDQRVQNITYNPDRNEFLASWWDSRPSLDEGGVIGRIIGSDGIPASPDFVLADAAGSQSFPHLLYIEKRKMYFAVWDDKRNEDSADEEENRDIYAKWLSPSGESITPDIPIHTDERNQSFSEVAYSPVMDRFLIAWRIDVDEVIIKEGETGHITESGGNIMGKIYGVPSFLTARVVEQETGTPVKDAWGFVVGPSFPAMEKTNIGGWLNISENSQQTGMYLILVFKLGYQISTQFVNYTGEPLQVTVEMSKWW